MRYLLLLFMLLPTFAFAEHGLPDALDEANELAIWTFILSTTGWAFRSWWKTRLETKHKVRVEKRLENEWTNANETLPGTKNPGRTQAQLVEIVHEGLQQHVAETNARFDKVHTDLGKIKGKLGID